MQKIVINGCYGGFSLSDCAVERLREWGHSNASSFHDIQRDDPLLIQVVEELGERANGKYADLSVISIPDNIPWHIEEYDGNEWVAEDHRTWGR